MKKIIVFGATGFIGSHVVESFARHGLAVTAVVRPGGDHRFIDTLPVEKMQLGDFSQDSLSRAVRGFDQVINCTADVRINKSLATYRETQVALTERMARAAIGAGVPRFMQLSTIEVYGRRPPHAIDEDHPARPVFAFQRACYEREQVLRQLNQDSAMELVILRPAATFGRRSDVMDIWIEAHGRGEFPMLGKGAERFSAIDTRDIGDAFAFLALAPEAAGQTYVLKGYETSWQEIKTLFDRVRGRESKARILPLSLAYVLATLMEWFTPKSREPMLTRFIVHVAGNLSCYDDSKIRALGFRPRYGVQQNFANMLAESAV